MIRIWTPFTQCIVQVFLKIVLSIYMVCYMQKDIKLRF